MALADEATKATAIVLIFGLEEGWPKRRADSMYKQQ